MLPIGGRYGPGFPADIAHTLHAANQDVFMSHHFLDYYRCQEPYAGFATANQLSEHSGYFRWGQDTVCYGRMAGGTRADHAHAVTYDAKGDVAVRDSQVYFPFDPEEVTENLQRERYSAHFRDPGRLSNEILRKIYYRLRPWLSVSIRKHLQKAHLRKWKEISFPEWPVDVTVDHIHRRRMALAMQAQGIDRVPFIWFWPDNCASCCIVTHDVEDVIGRDFCEKLMDLDESFGFRSSFQVVPEDRYPVPSSYLKSIVDRGFEVNVHDLKHDGRLYAEYAEFRRRAVLINAYGRQFGASGFRSGILYRNADWYDAFDFLYDMSIPNVAHLDPQHGGCCTVMPYFVGDMVELPVTCTQDYTLFHILKDYSIDLWKKQIELIRGNYGLVSILVHPDYVIEEREQQLYRDLLQYLADLRDTDHMWTPLPGDAARWWQQRRQMRLVREQGQWRIEGPGSERARIAYACADGDQVTYGFEAERVSVLS